MPANAWPNLPGRIWLAESGWRMAECRICRICCRMLGSTIPIGAQALRLGGVFPRNGIHRWASERAASANGYVSDPDTCHGPTQGDREIREIREIHDDAHGYKETVEDATGEGQPGNPKQIQWSILATAMEQAQLSTASTASAYGIGQWTACLHCLAATDLGHKEVQRSSLVPCVKATNPHSLRHICQQYRACFRQGVLARTAFPERSPGTAAGTWTAEAV